MRNKKFGGLGKVLATGALAAVALAAPLKVKATTLDYVNTIIHNTEDMDSEREGVQWRYDWEVKNDGAGDWEPDSVWKYTIQANLEERGMYGMAIQDSFGDWSYNNGIEGYFQLDNSPPQAYPIYPEYTATFSAFIDADQVLGNEWVGSYGLSNNGDTQIVDVQVPIPEPTTISLLAGGALAALAGRRIKDNYKKF